MPFRLARPLKKTTRHGFSLLELLVALVIVAILTKLGFSTFGELRERSAASRCIANLRNIGGALMAFGADHNGSTMPQVTSPGTYWHPIIDEYLGGRGREIDGISVSSPVWACPKNEKMVKGLKKKGTEGGQFSGYPINTHLLVKGETEVKPGKVAIWGMPMARINKPSQKIWIIESCHETDGAFGPATAMTYTPYGYKSWMKQVHPGGNNVLFCDGHIEPVKPDHPLCSNDVTVCSPWWYPAK